MKRLYFVLFILFPFFSNGQISYDHDINLPDTAFRGGTPQDIIYADGHIFVYTLKAILIYNESREYENKIEFGSLGRFAMQYPGSRSLIPDSRMMAFNPTNHQLYFVTPSLNVRQINTLPLDVESSVVIHTPDTIMGEKLHAYTKLTCDQGKGRLYWLTLVQNDNYHSWDSFFGVYKNTQGSGNFTNIYNEFKKGSAYPADYYNLMQTYAYNTSGKDYFYVSRKLKIDVMEVLPNDSVILKKRIATSSIRTAKMVLVDDDGIDLLLSFPSMHPDTSVIHPEHEKIFQINTQNPNDYDSIIAPSKIVSDAIYLSGQNHILTCFSSLNDFIYQLDTSGRDVALFNYNSNDGIFKFHQSLSTQSPGEADTSSLSLNRPLRLLEKPNGNAFLSKKNEIVEIVYNSTGSYTSNSKYYAKDSFFGKGVSFGNNTFVINPVNAGFEFFHTALGHGTKRTAYPAFNNEHNPINRNLYFFNRLTTENTGFYIYNPDIDSVDAFVETPRAIGDLVYNPALNHILVTEFSKNTGTTEGIRVYDGNNGAFLQTLSFAGTNFLGRMFVAPNSKIYVSANMKTDNTAPQLLVLDASDYSNYTSINIGLDEGAAASYNLRSHFCYNPYNEKVYAAFSHFTHGTPPFQNSYNGSSAPFGDITSPEDTLQSVYGWLMSISGTNLYVIDTGTIQNIGELICTTPDSIIDPKSNYQGTLFINGLNGLHLLDCKTNTLNPTGLSRIVDMDYSPRTNCLYAYYHYHIGQVGLDTNKIKVYKIKEDGSYSLIWERDGFGASVSYNRYDDQLYCYYRTDNRILGSNPARVISINTNTGDQTGSVSLPTYSLMPEVVPQTNNAFFDPYGKAYFPNGMHSSVSVLDFEGGNEALHLTPGPNWISIPRLQNNSTTNYMEYDTIPDVFDRNRFASPYSTLTLEHNRVFSSTDEQDYTADWKEEGGWNFEPEDPDNQNAFSYRGYILELEPDGNNTLYMKGQIKDPATSFPLYKDKKNWVGYFLVQEQDIFDALGNTADSLNFIKHQDWTCLRGLPYGPEPNPESNWFCDNTVHNIKYADMVVLKGGRSDFVFQWSINGQLPGDENATQNPAYYSYEEQSNYTPLLIELDSADNPQEIAAFVNDTCIGATVVQQGDSIVAMRAYLQGSAGDSLTFEKHYANKSTADRIRSYYVWDSGKQLKQKRTVRLGERKDHYFISFKQQKAGKRETDKLDFHIWPNPAADRLFYRFTLDEETHVSIAVFDIRGKLVAEPLHDAMQAGSTQGVIMLKSFTGEKLNTGIYLVKVKAGQILETKKVIVK